jgi:hypothetical protein
MGGVGELGELLHVSLFDALVEQVLLAGEIGLDADLDGEVGHGKHAGFLGEPREEPAGGLGFGTAQAS